MNYYGKQQCLDMDWNNTKEITAEEIAYCLHTHSIDISTVPKTRVKSVTKELGKLTKQAEQNQERKAIILELEYYQLETGFFYKLEEAQLAVNHIDDVWRVETRKIMEYNHQYKDNNYSRDRKRMVEAMRKVKEQYVAQGGLGMDFDKQVSQIPTPHKGTLIQDVNDNYDTIYQSYIDIGTPPTRAKRITKSILHYLLQGLLAIQEEY